jgi:hypothetical protein
MQARIVNRRQIVDATWVVVGRYFNSQALGVFDLFPIELSGLGKHAFFISGENALLRMA